MANAYDWEESPDPFRDSLRQDTSSAVYMHYGSGEERKALSLAIYLKQKWGKIQGVRSTRIADVNREALLGKWFAEHADQQWALFPPPEYRADSLFRKAIITSEFDIAGLKFPSWEEFGGWVLLTNRSSIHAVFGDEETTTTTTTRRPRRGIPATLLEILVRENLLDEATLNQVDEVVKEARKEFPEAPER